MSDLISRQQAIDALDKIFPADPMRNDYTQGITCGAALAEEYIKQLPSVTPAPEKCYNKNHDYAECDQFVCSRCGIELQDWCRVERDEDGDITYHEYEFNYCPNCGAKL